MIEGDDIEELIKILNIERVKVIRHYNKNITNKNCLLIHVQQKIFYRKLNIKLNMLIEIIELLKEYKIYKTINL